MRTLFCVAAVVVAMGWTAASAHHSFGATYEVAKQVKVEGTIVQFIYRNPHSFVHVQAPDESGEMQRWAVEWGGTTQLNSQGVKADTLKIGDKVVIVGRPSRVPGEYRLLMLTLTRPSDGFTWGRGGAQVVD